MHLQLIIIQFNLKNMQIFDKTKNVLKLFELLKISRVTQSICKE